MTILRIGTSTTTLMLTLGAKTMTRRLLRSISNLCKKMEDSLVPKDVLDDEKIAAFFCGYEIYLGISDAKPNTKSTLLHKMWRPSNYTEQPSENLKARVELAKWLLSNHPELLGMKDHHGNTPLIDAVKNDCKLLVDCYLASPGGVNAILVQGSGGDTCLTVCLAVEEGVPMHSPSVGKVH